jgi:hypothetical protein
MIVANEATVKEFSMLKLHLSGEEKKLPLKTSLKAMNKPFELDRTI